MNTSRQSDLIPEDKLYARFVIIGCGAIGSNVARMLALTGFTDITVFDSDILGEENFGPGFFDKRMSSGLGKKGQPKVNACRSAILFCCDTRITAIPEDWNGQVVDTDVLIVGVDSKEVRDAIWALRDRISTKLWVDGGIGGHACNTISFDPSSIAACESYARFLDIEPEPLPCARKATAYISAAVTAQIGNTIARWVNGENVPFIQSVNYANNS